MRTATGNDKTINFWRARRVKGLGFYKCTDDYMFSLDFETDTKLLEPGALLEFEGKTYRVAAKQIAFVKRDDYARTQRLSPIYHIFLEDGNKSMHLYGEDVKKNRLTVKKSRIKKPRGAKTPEVQIPREVTERKQNRLTKEEKLLVRHKKAQTSKKRAEKRKAKRKGSL